MVVGLCLLDYAHKSLKLTTYICEYKCKNKKNIYACI